MENLRKRLKFENMYEIEVEERLGGIFLLWNNDIIIEIHSTRNYLQTYYYMKIRIKKAIAPLYMVVQSMLKGVTFGTRLKI